ncbi:MAG: hypothetical protein HND48_11640 [Chloroflexi bacterium]|nr:hypothetical protein [Chloroflexota bacterium]
MGLRTIVRAGLVYGPDDAFINHIAMMLSTNPVFFLMPGNGEVVLHPIHVDDVVSVLMAALERVDTVDLATEVGGAEYTTLLDLIRTIMRVTGMRRLIIPTPPVSAPPMGAVCGGGVAAVAVDASMVGSTRHEPYGADRQRI